MRLSEQQIAEVERIVEAVRPLLAGHAPEVQGAALADLLAILLAGHVAGEDTDRLREEILALHIVAVRELVPINEALLAGRR